MKAPELLLVNCAGCRVELIGATNTSEVVAAARRDGKSLAHLLRRPGVTVRDLAESDPHLRTLAADPAVCEQVEIETKYEGYIRRQREQIAKFRSSEDRKIPAWLDYGAIDELRHEAREKLDAVRPESFGQASRISGISPADIAILMIYMEGRRRLKAVRGKASPSASGK